MPATKADRHAGPTAIKAGADYLVVGRQWWRRRTKIAADAIVAEIDAAI
jgi:hypothetical protein